MSTASRASESSPPRAPDPLVGRVLNDRYRLDSLIARGGMGAVYKAEHLQLGLACAVKVVTVQEVGIDEHRFLERFAREATMTARLRHPNTVQVFDCGHTEDGVHYLTMELLEGQTLLRAIRTTGPFPAARFFRVAKQLAAGVKAAHELGIVHRDLKPSNIFLVHPQDGEETVKVLDFGVAKPIQGEVLALTRPGTILGTPKYMAPEQILGGPVSERSDIYAIGVILFELLVGRAPFVGDSEVDVMAGHVREPIPPMGSVRAEAMIPADLEHLVRRLLVKDPAHRITRLADVLEALGQLEVVYAGGATAPPSDRTGLRSALGEDHTRPSRPLGAGVSTPALADDHTRPSRPLGAAMSESDAATVVTPPPHVAMNEASFGVGSLLEGRYRIDGRLGEGQSGEVFAATFEKTGRKLAVKLMHACNDDPQAVVRCMREARSASQVIHPNIVEVSDVGMIEGRPYVVMERLFGGSLAKVLESTAIRRAELLSSLVPAMRGLAASHAAGIAHSDLKPSDLMVGPPINGRTRVVVIDFGVARLIDEPHLRMTRAGAKTVPPYYAAPEQLRRQPHDHRVDIYSMGVIAYEVVTGVRPFEGRSYGGVTIDIASAEVTPPSVVAPSVPVELSNIIMKAMAREPKDRFQTMQAFVSALAPYTLDVDRDFESVPSIAPTTIRPPGMRRWIVPMIGLLALLAFVTIAAAMYVMQ